MSAQIGSLFASLALESNPFIQGMAQVERTTSTTMASVRRQAGLTERAVSGVQKSFSQPIRPYSLIAASRAFQDTTARASLLKGAIQAVSYGFGGLAAVLSGGNFLRQVTTFTELENQLRAVSGSTSEVKAEFIALQAVAERSRSSLDGTVTLFSRLTRAAPDLNPDKVLRYVETISKALQLGGASADEARSAAIQFSQAIASNRLGGDELRAILETPLGGFLAKGLGVTIGKLREMGAEGKLTANVVLGAIDSISSSVDRQFSNSVETVSQALTVAENKLIQYAGSVDQSYGVTRLLSSGITGLANNLDNLGLILKIVAPLALSIFAGKRLGLGLFGRDEIGKATGSIAKLADGFSNIKSASQAAIESSKSDLKGLTNSLRETKSELGAMKLIATKGRSPTAFADKNLVADAARAEAELLRIDQQRATVTEKLSKARAAAGVTEEQTSRRLISLSEAEIAAANRTSTARASAIEKINRLSSQQIALEEKHQAVSQRVGQLVNERDNSAVRNLNAQISTLSTQSTNLVGRLATTRSGLLAATQAATPLGIAFATVRTAGAGLLGFLGGPWGVALTVATGAMILLGEKSSSSAQEVAAAEEVITRRLGKMAESSKEAKRAFEDLKLDAGIKAAQSDIDVSANQIGKLTDNVRAYAAAIDVFRQQRGDFEDRPNAPLAVPFSLGLVKEIQAGTKSTEEATKAAKDFFEQQLVDPSQTQDLLAEIATTKNYSTVLRDATKDKKKLADIRFNDGQKLPIGDIEQSFRKNQANNTQAQEIIGAIQQQKSEQQKIADEIKKSLEGAGIEVSPAIQKMIDAQAKATTLLQGLDKAVSDSKSILDNTTSEITTFAGIAVSKTSNIAAQLAQLRQISDQIKVDKDALAAAQSELKNTPDLTQAAFGKFDPANLKAVNDEIARTRTEIAQLAKDFEAGKISGTDLFTAIDGIAARLRALGGEGNTLDPFINGIYKALAAIPQLKSALDGLAAKFNQTKQKQSGLGDFIGQDAASQQYKNSKGVVSRVVNTPDGPVTIHNTTSFGEGGFTSEDFNVPGGVVRRTQASGGGSSSPVPGVDKAVQQSLTDASKALDAVTGSLGSASDKAPVFRKTLADMGVAAETSATQTGTLNDKLVAVSSPSNNISPFITSIDEANNKVPILLSELDQLIAKFNAVSNAKSNALSGDASSGSTSSDSSPSQSEKFATGGIFNVGGSGGVDSQLVQFMASPDETVAIYTPAQMSKLNAALGGSSEGGGSVYHISQTIVASDVQSYKNSAAQVRSDFTSMIRATTRAAPV